ncbi:MAG: type II toxin-antitoxin system VapC family toxin [Candidatus Acidiferrum sp.]
MRVLVDTNVLLRAVQSNHPLFAQATQGISVLVRRNDSVCFCSQNIIEFWNVATRPIERNGFGLSTDQVLKEIAGFESSLSLLPDLTEIYTTWKQIVSAHKVQGVQVHDARLVAIMRIYSVDALLTFNAADFARFASITVIHPSSLAPKAQA